MSIGSHFRDQSPKYSKKLIFQTSLDQLIQQVAFLTPCFSLQRTGNISFCKEFHTATKTCPKERLRVCTDHLARLDRSLTHRYNHQHKDIPPRANITQSHTQSHDRKWRLCPEAGLWDLPYMGVLALAT